MQVSMVIALSQTLLKKWDKTLCKTDGFNERSKLCN